MYKNGKKVDTEKFSNIFLDVIKEIAEREGLIPQLVPQDDSHRTFRMAMATISNQELFLGAIHEAVKRYKKEEEDANNASHANGSEL